MYSTVQAYILNTFGKKIEYILKNIQDARVGWTCAQCRANTPTFPPRSHHIDYSPAGRESVVQWARQSLRQIPSAAWQIQSFGLHVGQGRKHTLVRQDAEFNDAFPQGLSRGSHDRPTERGLKREKSQSNSLPEETDFCTVTANLCRTKKIHVIFRNIS